MANWVRIGIGGFVRGGTTLLAYLLLCPAIWSRSVFEGFEIAIALAVAGGWGFDRAAMPVAKWARYQLLISIGFVATLVPVAVLLEALFGDESALTTAKQRIAFGSAVVISMCFWVWLRPATRIPAFTDTEGESRRNAIRANIRHEIDEIERSARGAPGSAKHSED